MAAKQILRKPEKYLKFQKAHTVITVFTISIRIKHRTEKLESKTRLT